VSELVVTGGTVLAPGGPIPSDVFVAEGRIVSVRAVVGTTGQQHGGPDGRIENGTVGAGAERSVVDAPVQDDADPAAGERSPAAGGVPGTAQHVRGQHLDATGLLVAPGFIDLQCNGAVGVDLTSEPERLTEVAAALPGWGVTAWLPTVVTAPPSARSRAMTALAAFDDPAAAVPLGLHLEGPFLAPERRGAHDPSHLAPPSVDVVAAEGWAAAAGVALVTLAPELPGALDVVRTLVERGVTVAAGHSSATAVQAAAALDAGVTYVTHLFNAMAPLHHREPGLAGVALTDDRARVGLIADGIHVDPVVARLAVGALGDRLSLVTDAVAALGAGPGAGNLGSRGVEVAAADLSVRLPDGTLAGSTLALDRAVRNAMAFAGLDLAAAVRAVTAVPAAVLGLADRGVVAPGAVADLVLLTPDGEVVATVVGGRVVHDTRRVA
jgi:N-acetylglucosamine-6-phosphate deacetylase